jgi:hypothetical protein
MDRIKVENMKVKLKNKTNISILLYKKCLKLKKIIVISFYFFQFALFLFQNTQMMEIIVKLPLHFNQNLEND